MWRKNFPRMSEWEYWCENWFDAYPLTGNVPVTASSPYIGTSASVGVFSQADGYAKLSGAAAADNSGVQIQTDIKAFSLRKGKTVEFVGEFSLSDAVESEFLFGLCVHDTTLLDGTGSLSAGLTHTDGVGIYKPDGSGDIYGYIRRDNVQANTGGLATLSDGTKFTVGVRIEMDPSVTGKGYVSFWKDGNILGGTGPALSSTTMPYEAEEYLALSIALLSGNSSGTKSLFCYGLEVFQER